MSLLLLMSSFDSVIISIIIFIVVTRCRSLLFHCHRLTVVVVVVVVVVAINVSIIVLIRGIDIIVVVLLKTHLCGQKMKKMKKKKKRKTNEKGKNKNISLFQIDFFDSEKMFPICFDSNTSFHFLASKTIFLKQLEAGNRKLDRNFYEKWKMFGSEKMVSKGLKVDDVCCVQSTSPCVVVCIIKLLQAQTTGNLRGWFQFDTP